MASNGITVGHAQLGSMLDQRGDHAANAGVLYCTHHRTDSLWSTRPRLAWAVAVLILWQADEAVYFLSLYRLCLQKSSFKQSARSTLLRRSILLESTSTICCTTLATWPMETTHI